MSGTGREVEHRYMGKKRLPHCRTCKCKENVHIPTRMEIPSPRLDELWSRCPTRKTRDCCRTCHHRSPSDEGITREYCPEMHYAAPEMHCVAPKVKIEKPNRSDHKFTTLETWFKQFDFDGNGLIDVYELKSLLNHLGLKCDQEYVKELIKSADRDRDGMLSFSDFLYMWSQAAQEEDIDLCDVVKEHGLYPDIVPPPKHNRKLQMKKTVRHHEPRRECSCCEIRQMYSEGASSMRKEVDLDMRVSRSPTHYNDEFPVLSCHR